MSKRSYERRIKQKREQEKARRRRERRMRVIRGVALAAVALGALIAILLWSPWSGGGKPAALPSASPGDSPSACTTPGPATRGKREFQSAPCMAIDPSGEYTATMKTSKGTMVLRLLAERAPQTVNNFVFLARNDFYDDLTFHRVIPGFMIQGGDPAGTGSGGPGYQFGDENTERQFDKPGLLAMANSGPATNGSQFFITEVTIEHLNAKGACPGPQGCHSVFGELVSGMDVLKAIVNTPRDESDKPKTPVRIIDVVIEER